MGARACAHLDEAIHCIIDRHSQEYNLSYSEVLGVLEIVKQDVLRQFYEDEEECEED